MPTFYNTLNAPRTDYEKLQSGNSLYAYEQKKKKKKNNLNNTGGIKAPIQPGGKNYDYTDYKTGKLVEVGPVVGTATKGQDATDLDRVKLGKKNAKFTQKYNNNAKFRDNVNEGRADKSGFAGSLNTLVAPALSHVSQTLDTVKSSPEQALLGGLTPAGAKFWNSVAGTDFEPQTTWTGGATDDQIAQMEAEGINTDNFQTANTIADTIALMYAGNYGANALGGAAGGGGAGGGGGVSGGASGASSTAGGGSSLFSNSGGGMSGNWLNNAILAGSSLASGYLSKEATEAGIDANMEQYEQTREDMEPWRLAGKKGLKKYAKLLGQDTPDFEFSLEDDPVYQFQVDEALKATERAMAARGYSNSGNILRELQDTAIGEAGNYQNDAFNRQLATSQTNYGRDFDLINQYANLAGLGQSTTNALANAGANTANSLSNLYLQQGQGYNNAIQGAMQNYMLSNYLNQGY